MADKKTIKPSAVDFDFDGVINKITSEGISRDKLLEILTQSQSLLVKLGSLETMTKYSREEVMIQARQTINILFKEYKKIVHDESLKVYVDSVDVLGKAIGKAFGKNFDLPKWDKINNHLMSEKFDALHYYLNRSVFMLDQRVTLFELQGKKNLQEAVIQRILQERGGKGYNDILDDLMKMLDTHYPGGYIPLPVIRNGQREFRKISLDYYLETWINDVESSVQHWAQRSTYLKAGIDLVEIHTQENEACPICSPEVNKIYSLSGADPDFKRMEFVIPRHPNCDCYMVPVVADIQPLPDHGLSEGYPGLSDMQHQVEKYTQGEGIPFSGFNVMQAGENPLMAASNKGIVSLNDTPLAEHKGFNPYMNLHSALDKMKTGKVLQYNEHEALASLRHELYHVANKGHFRIPNESKENLVLELIVEFSSRYNYPQFYESISKKMHLKSRPLSSAMAKRIQVEGYGYSNGIQRVHKFLEVLKIKPDDIREDIEKIVQQSSTHYKKSLIKLLIEKSNQPEKVIDMVLTHLTESPDVLFKMMLGVINS